ncbi:piggyBac transposable element-derived protein 4-like [Diorhabda sublineata]|uniref:piggyBac transposable element-derived protein 4-like n=1 Tax=Diorhabda sublineata TaxID=1163346 RepID=UPI0024E05518|nr:piggyBac transposable element-derived protein 4-like [Diorhabda sublineata]
MVDASPYLGIKTSTNGLPLANYFMTEPTKSIYGSNNNVTVDNWFTSVSLADELLKDPYKLTIIGTPRSKKKEIPPVLLPTRQRNANTSMFCYDQEKVLLSYVSRKQKVVLLLSTMHQVGEISEETGKPAIVQNYNETKVGVDTFDQLCTNMSCSRKTKRWPLCVVLYVMINMANNNSFVIYSNNTLKRGEKSLSRYAIDLSRRLADEKISGTNFDVKYPPRNCSNFEYSK